MQYFGNHLELQAHISRIVLLLWYQQLGNVGEKTLKGMGDMVRMIWHGITLDYCFIITHFDWCFDDMKFEKLSDKFLMNWPSWSVNSKQRFNITGIYGFLSKHFPFILGLSSPILFLLLKFSSPALFFQLPPVLTWLHL